MKDVRFYLEYPSKKDKNEATRKNLGNHSGNCVALYHKNYRVTNDDVLIEAASAVYMWENSDCAFSEVSQGYIDEKCKRISEEQAREIHPQLFTYLNIINE